MHRRTTFLAATLLAIAALGLSGCATAPGPQFAGLGAVPTGNASVYIYRKAALFAVGQSFKVDIDKAPAGAIFNASYLLAQVAPGAHTVTVKPGGMAKDFSLDINAEAGKNYFVEFVPNSGLLANPFFLGSETLARTEDQATKDLAALKSAK